MFKTRRLVYASFFIALSVAFTRILTIQIFIAGVGSVRLGFGPLPIILSGIFLGPLAGGIIGTLADILGYLLNPMGGGYVPIITLVSTATGIIPPLILNMLGERTQYRFVDLLISIGITQFVLALILMPMVLYKWFGVPIWINVPVRIVAQAILIPIYTSIIHILTKRLPKAIPSFGKTL